MRRLLLPLQFVLLVLLAYAYLYPGSQALIDQRTDTVMSDDTDPATLPYQYGNLIKVWEEHPSRLFLGTVYYEGHDPEFGMAYWMPWCERWIVLFWSNFFPVEQLSTALIFTLMLLNGLCMYGLARYLDWNISVSSGLALAWAFCAYTRARAKVHGAMVGIYHLPLLFLGLFLVTRGKGRKSLLGAAACFLGAVTAATYYIMNSLFLAPFFLLFLVFQPEARQNPKRVSARLAVALLPAMLFLAFNYFKTIPSDARMSTAQSYPQGGEIADGSTHPYLYYYAAHPIDYLGGDISLHNIPDDPSPARQWINEKIIDSIRGTPSNTHERTNGIRWSLLIIAAAALVFLALGRFKDDKITKNNLIFFTLFALFTFWLSLSPDVPFKSMGPSLWLQSLVHQMRVPSRAGINVNFAVLMIVGFFLAGKIRWRKLVYLPGVFPLLMVAGYPPLVQNMPMAPIRPPYTELLRDKGECGAGMYFPFVSFYQAGNIEYILLQRMRGSDCKILNAMMNVNRVKFLLQRFPPAYDYLRQLDHDQTRTAETLERYARCVPLTWLIFDGATPQQWREDLCHRLGWTLYPDLTCVSPNKGQPLQRYPDDCG